MAVAGDVEGLEKRLGQLADEADDYGDARFVELRRMDLGTDASGTSYRCVMDGRVYASYPVPVLVGLSHHDRNGRVGGRHSDQSQATLQLGQIQGRKAWSLAPPGRENKHASWQRLHGCGLPSAPRVVELRRKLLRSCSGPPVHCEQRAQ